MSLSRTPPPQGDPPPSPGFSVFLSYASEDRAAVSKFSAVLRAAGIDVWFDADELTGGDAWDDHIRERIKNCTFFVPVVSKHTQDRSEGYFRREWRFAIERSHDMADDRPFIVPVALIDIRPEIARVPKRFADLHWIRLPDGDHGERLAEGLNLLHGKVLAKAAGESPDSGASPHPGAPPLRPERRRPFAPLLAIVASGLVLALAWAWWDYIHAPPAPTATEPARAQPDMKSLAVLPFANTSGDPKDDYLSDGLSEELLAALGRDPTLHIVARTSSFAFKGLALTAQQIASRLGVAKLVEGSVRRSGDRLKIDVELVNGFNGFRLWSHDYPFLLRDIFDVQSTVANDVVAQIFPNAGRPPATQRGTTRNLDAYDAFLRARSFQAKSPTQANLEQAREFFQKATAADPNYAVAWARLGSTLLRLRTTGYDDSEVNLQQVHEAIERARSIDPNLPEALAANADYLKKDWTNQGLAEKELQLALQGLPNDPDILMALASCSMNLGRKSKAVLYARQAAELDPENGDTANYCAVVLDTASLYPEALDECDRAYRVAGWAVSLANKAITYRNWKGSLDLALQTLDQSLSSASNDEDRNYCWRLRSALLRAKGDFKEALRSVDQIDRESIPSQFFYPSKSLLSAQIHESMGDKMAARREYGRALADAETYRSSNPGILRAHTSLALIYAGLGREADALATVQRCLELLSPEENPFIASRTGLRVRAQIDARFGHMDLALETVKKEIDAGFWKRQDLLLDPDWELLRKDARFQSLAQTAEP